MQTLPKIDRRAWLAIWAQDRRRARQRQQTPPVSSLRTGLVAHFPLDEFYGSRFDVVNGYELGCYGSGQFSLPGRIGNAAILTGNGHLLGTMDTTTFTPTAAGFAVSFWVNLSTNPYPTSTVVLAGVGNGTTWPANSVWRISGISMGYVWADLPYCPDLLFAIGNLNQWAHVALVMDGATNGWKLYLNGTLGASLTMGCLPLPGRLGLGNLTQPTDAEGIMILDEFSVWSRPLSAAEISQLYNNGAGLVYPF